MRRGVRRSSWFVVAVATAALVVAACGDSDFDAKSHIEVLSAETTSTMMDHSTREVTTINGSVPDGRPSPIASRELILREPTGRGTEVMVIVTTRTKGTRSPIHMHELGGTTCVLQGKNMFFLEGSEPREAAAGTCYYMPAGRTMSAYAIGDVDTVMQDIFEVPIDTPVWMVVEAGQTGAQGQFGVDSTTTVNR